jgi:hypothetical protein
MKHIHTFESFLNEGKLETWKSSNGDTTYSPVDLPGFPASMIIADKNSAKVAKALIDYWMSNKSLPNGLTVSGGNEASLENESFTIVAQLPFIKDSDFKVTITNKMGQASAKLIKISKI